MRLSTALPLIWAASIQALPQGIDGSMPTGGTGPDKPLTTDQICALKFESGDLTIAGATWKGSGADTFLANWLKKNGPDDWADKIIQSTIGNGEGGSSINCKNFPAANTCNPPQPGTCAKTNPPAMFFIQLSMANCFSMFDSMHEAMQDYVLSQLTSGIKSITADFAPPQPQSSVLTMLIGAFVSAAAFAGPLWQIGAPLTLGVGIMNLVSGAINSNPPALDTNDALENQLGKIFTPFQNNLATQVDSIFKGTPPILSGFSSDDAKILGGLLGPLSPFFGDSSTQAPDVYKIFEGGRFVDSTLVSDTANKWKETTTHLMTQGLVIAALDHDGWVVFVDTARTDQGACNGVPGTQWIGNECYMLAKSSGNNGGDPFTTPSNTVILQDDTMVKKLTDSSYPYQFNLNQFFTNAKDCNGGKQDYSIPSYDSSAQNQLPKCFVNLKVMKAAGSPFDSETS